MRLVWHVALSTLLVGLTLPAAGQVYAQEQHWRYSSPRSEIQQTGQAARKQSPECGEAADGLQASEVAVKAGADALKKLLESEGISKPFAHGVGEGLLKLVADNGNAQWLRDRFGVSNGLSKCATQCVVYPTEKAEHLSIFGCLSETGGDGLDCGNNGWDGKVMGAYNLTHSTLGHVTISCMSGKNWSHNRNRWFFVVATDVNPLSGEPLNGVHR